MLFCCGATVIERGMSRQPVVRTFFNEPTNTVSYIAADPVTKEAAVIDPVLDYDHSAGSHRWR